MRLSTEMDATEVLAFDIMQVVYRQIIQTRIDDQVVHMATFQRQADISGLRRVEGGYVNPRSTYVAISITAFNAEYGTSFEWNPNILILAVRCVEENTVRTLMILRSELADGPDGDAVDDHVIRVTFEVNFAEGCAMCGLQPSRVCSRCRQVRYCSRECQIVDFPNHRDGCMFLGSTRRSSGSSL